MTEANNVAAAEAELVHLPLNRIRRNPKIDPRKGRNAQKFQSLVESIRLRGVIQPITVRPIKGDENFDYEVVAGNSRFDASNEAGRATIPAAVRELNDFEARILAGVENLQRADLTPIEEAAHAQDLLTELKHDHAEVCRILDWSRTKLDSRILLTHACPEVAEALLQGQIKLGHAELLCGLRADEQPTILKKIIDNNISVTDTRSRLIQFSRKLETARFDLSECQGCPNNSSTFKDMFDTSMGDGYCTNHSCWGKKTEHLIAVTVEQAEKDFGVVHLDTNLPKDGYTKLNERGQDGVGIDQIAACASCATYGAVISSVVGNEGAIAGGYCFNLGCHSEKVAVYQSLLASDNPNTPTVTNPEGKQTKQPSGAGAGADKAKQPAQPQELKKSIRREAFKLYSQVGAKAVQADKALALAISIVAVYQDMRNDLPDELRNRIKNQIKMPDYMGADSRPKVELELAKRPVEELESILIQLASCTVFRRDVGDTFEKSLPGAQSLAYIKHSGAEVVEHFLMNQAYLDSLTKSGVIEECKASGFAARYDQEMGDGSFTKLASGKAQDLTKAVLEFKAFDWKGYLPKNLEVSRQSGSATPEEAAI